MARVLFANIGNRNLRDLRLNLDLSDKTLLAHYQAESFRELTERFLSDAALHLPHLQLNILDTLLGHAELLTDKVILFGSNQSGLGTRDNQDTCFAAKLAQLLIERDYPQLNNAVEVIELKCKVTEEEDLIKDYQIHLKKRLSLGDVVQFCEAGGTSQQKMALRLVLEFNVPSDYLEIWYVDQEDRQQSKARRVTGTRLRKLLTRKTTEDLLQRSDYWGAILAQEGEIKPQSMMPSNPTSKIMYHAAYRAELKTKASFNYIIGNLKNSDWNQLPAIVRISDWELSYLGAYVGQKAWNECCELLSLAQLYVAMEAYQEFLRFAYAFQEVFLYAYVETNIIGPEGKKYKLYSEYGKSEESFAKFLKQDSLKPVFADYLSRLGRTEVRISISTIILAVQHNEAQKNEEQPSIPSQLLAHFYSLNDELGAKEFSKNIPKPGWRFLRNDLSHSGKGLLREELNNSCPHLIETYFLQWLAWAGIPTPGLYQQLNAHIIELLKKS